MQDCSILAVTRDRFEELCNAFPQVDKTLRRITKAVEVGDRIALIKELETRRGLQELRVRELIHGQTRTQVFLYHPACTSTSMLCAIMGMGPE